MTPAFITIVGNLTRDPEFKAFESGQSTCRLSVAANRRVINRANLNARNEVVSYYDVVVWGGLAENVRDSLGRGARIVVSGRLDQRSWVDAEGKRRYAYEIVADEVGASLRFATAHLTRKVRQSLHSPAEGEDDGNGTPHQAFPNGEPRPTLDERPPYDESANLVSVGAGSF